MGGGKAGGGEHGSAKSEGESEDGMLPLDHFQGDAEVVEDGHGKIVEQWSVVSVQCPVLSSQFSVLRKAKSTALGCADGKWSCLSFAGLNKKEASGCA
jgi:hypothetical protein